MHILVSWFDQQFVLLACFILAYVLTQEIEPLLDMSDARFFPLKALIRALSGRLLPMA